MCILQDFEALTPNLLARTIETVEGGGLVILLLKTMTSLKQLYTMTMVGSPTPRRTARASTDSTGCPLALPHRSPWRCRRPFQRTLHPFSRRLLLLPRRRRRTQCSAHLRRQVRHRTPSTLRRPRAHPTAGRTRTPQRVPRGCPAGRRSRRDHKDSRPGKGGHDVH